MIIERILIILALLSLETAKSANVDEYDESEPYKRREPDLLQPADFLRSKKSYPVKNEDASVKRQKSKTQQVTQLGELEKLQKIIEKQIENLNEKESLIGEKKRKFKNRIKKPISTTNAKFSSVTFSTDFDEDKAEKSSPTEGEVPNEKNKKKPRKKRPPTKLASKSTSRGYSKVGDLENEAVGDKEVERSIDFKIPSKMFVEEVGTRVNKIEMKRATVAAPKVTKFLINV